jgi:hypothetical protein
VGKAFTRIKDMNTGVWQFIKIIAETYNTIIAEVICEMAELYAKVKARFYLAHQ